MKKSELKILIRQIIKENQYARAHPEKFSNDGRNFQWDTDDDVARDNRQEAYFAHIEEITKLLNKYVLDKDWDNARKMIDQLEEAD